MKEKRINEKCIAKGLTIGFFIMIVLGAFGTFAGNKAIIFLSLLCSQICMTFLVVMIAKKVHTNTHLIKVLIYLNIIAFTSNIRMLGVSTGLNLLMTAIQCVCAVTMGIYILILARKFFDDVESKNGTIK